MKNFREVASRLRRVNVTAPTYGDSFGSLSLDGEESIIELTGQIPLEDLPSPGWFDLRLRSAEGEEIFIHNAVQTGMSFPIEGDARSVTLFPNMVVDDAAGLDEAGRCRRISFELDGWLACFAYRYIETIDPKDGKDPSLVEGLRSSRYASFRDDPFNPQRVHVVHDLGTLVEFEVDGRGYSVFAGVRYEGGRTRLNDRVSLIGTITFAEPLGLDDATEACWAWRRYFNQAAMSIMPFTGMSVAASTESRAPRGNLYLPSERSSLPLKRRSDRRGMPLSRWEERQALSETMRLWLMEERERWYFRAALDRVLSRPGHVAIEDAVALCAGLDTLSELSTKETLPKSVLNTMASAAVAVAADADIELDPGRVRGLLGSLQNDDLRRRLRRLAALAASETEEADVERWIEIILPLRLFGAHGRIPKTDHDLVAAPAVAALAALCARYDLQSAGMPDHEDDGSPSLPSREWEQAMSDLRRPVPPIVQYE
jgi:hypothetical protein